MLADPEIPVRVAHPFDVKILLEPKAGIQVWPSNQFIENDAVIDSLNRNFAAGAAIKQIPAALYHIGKADRLDSEQCFRSGKIDTRLLFSRFDLEQDHVLGIGIGQDGSSQQVDVLL